MRKFIVVAMATLTIAAGFAFGVSGGTQAEGPGTPACAGHLYTYQGEGESTTFTVPEVPADGYYWAWASVKAGSEQQGLGHDDIIELPLEGDVISHSSGKAVSHVDMCKLQGDPPPPPAPPNCDTSAIPGSVAGFLAEHGYDGGSCFDYTVNVECGVATGSVTNQPTPQYEAGPFRLVWNEGDGIANPYGPSNFPAVFAEDYNGGSVTISYYIVGPESDWFSTNSGGVPNYWNGIYVSTMVDTDCETPTTTTTETPTTTLPALVPDAEVICTSTGPDYVSWQLTNTGEVGIVSPVPLAPGESAILEEQSTVEGSLTVEVEFADESTGTFTYSGEGCSFVPPVATTQPPVTDPPSTDPPSTPPTTEPSGSVPSVTTTPPVVTPPASAPSTSVPEASVFRLPATL